MICDNISVRDGRLHFAGQDTVLLAEKYGTPLYLLDEDRVRHNCKVYKEAMDKSFSSTLPLYASKALSCKALYQIAAQEGLGVDVVSAGELGIAHAAGFPMERVFFHGCSKTDEEIAYGISLGVGYFIIDGLDELEAVDRLAGEAGICQKVLLRLTPGIDPHTFEAVCTGQVDSKFGVPIETGQAEAFLREALQKKNLSINGYHCHIGSQVFESAVFRDSADIMLTFSKEMAEKYNYYPQMLDLGGGYGVRYVESDPALDIEAEIAGVGEYLKAQCQTLGIAMPQILMEPGRSIVADAGMTLYTVEAVKPIPNCKTYICIDGGMTDNPRYALYGSQYTIYLANRPEEAAQGSYTIGGRCCESGDMIQENVPLPFPKRGETLAVCTTGAYNHSMSSNYNAVPRPPMVGLSQGENRLLIRRETLTDLLAREI